MMPSHQAGLSGQQGQQQQQQQHTLAMGGVPMGMHYQPMSAPPVQSNVIIAQTAELWLKIDQLHLNYLKAEETAAKMDIRKKLEGFIHQYLCLVPQERKFCNELTSGVLSESVRFLNGFSALKAARAFKALEEYAANLINQPWRKEFKDIKQYGGFYKHNIECALSGAERLFHLMGYESSSGQSLVLNGPVDQDRITTVARDCILAYMECQILVSIVQGVSNTFPCSWEEALNFRREHVGTPEQAVRSLVYMKYQEQANGGMGMAAAGSVAPSCYSTAHGGSVYSPQSFYQAQQYASLPPMVHAHNVNGLPQQMYPQVSLGNGVQPVNGIPLINGNHAMPMSLPQTISNPVPTGQLVDINGGQSNNNGNGLAASKRHSMSEASSNSGRAPAIPLTIKHLEEENRRKSYHENGAGTNYESWDYVYRQLENIGYTKDQGERPDVLALLNKVSLARQKSDAANQQQQRQQQRHDEDILRQAALSPLSREERDLLRQIQKVKLSADLAEPPPEDEPDAVHRRLRRNNSDARGGHNSRSKRDSHKAGSSSSQQQEKRRSRRHSRPLSPPSAMAAQYELRPDSALTQGSKSSKWQCRACTFDNKAGLDICRMCGKSRNSPLPSSQNGSLPAPSGDEVDGFHSPAAAVNGVGVACGKCTLVNSSNERVCEACGATLPHAMTQRRKASDSGNSQES